MKDKHTYKEYLDTFFKPGLYEVVILEIHYSFIEYQCHNEIKELLDFLRNNKNYSEASIFCENKINDLFNDEPDFDFYDDRFQFWADSNSFLKFISQINICVYLKTETYGLFDSSPVNDLKTLKDFFKMLRSEFLNASTEFFKEMWINFSLYRDDYRTIEGYDHVSMFIYLMERITNKLVLRKNYKGEESRLIKELYDFIDWAIWSQESLINELGWDEENNCLKEKNKHENIEQTSFSLHFDNNYNEKEMFQMINNFLQYSDAIMSAYELAVEKICEESDVAIMGEPERMLMLDSFADNHRNRIEELSLYEEKWIYNSYCSFLSN
ncbi:hypothetical protein [Spiroplasma endosymbiont of Aspidapion aeneum]|uniref:hypothetical protein n=1 Tax=Spiroplasma endosymbiont of Aspidapion aeneum TaxID=3066276 RepID=UPI00313AE2A6